MSFQCSGSEGMAREHQGLVYVQCPSCCVQGQPMQGYAGQPEPLQQPQYGAAPQQQPYAQQPLQPGDPGAYQQQQMPPTQQPQQQAAPIDDAQQQGGSLPVAACSPQCLLARTEHA